MQLDIFYIQNKIIVIIKKIIVINNISNHKNNVIIKNKIDLGSFIQIIIFMGCTLPIEGWGHRVVTMVTGIVATIVLVVIQYVVVGVFKVVLESWLVLVPFGAIWGPVVSSNDDTIFLYIKVTQ